MTFFTAIKKLIRRKKIGNYYNSEDIISLKEKHSLIIGFSIITIPLLIGLGLIILNL